MNAVVAVFRSACRSRASTDRDSPEEPPRPGRCYGIEQRSWIDDLANPRGCLPSPEDTCKDRSPSSHQVGTQTRSSPPSCAGGTVRDGPSTFSRSRL